MRITVLATGGTIAMRVAAGEGAAPADDAARLVAGLPLPHGIAVDFADVLAKPSPSIDLADVHLVATRIAAEFDAGADGVVVTHGTDTLEETAFTLALMLAPAGAPVVVTGAMRSADQVGADGPANLAAAIRLAADPAARAQGVLVLFGDEIHAAHLVRKVHSSRVHAFSSEPFGPVGHIVENGVRIELSPRGALPRLVLADPKAHLPVVPIVQVGLGFEAATIEALGAGGIDGLIVAGVGGGHVSAAAAPAIGTLARRIPVVMTSRVGMGETMRATYAYAGGDIDLARRGVLNGGRWRPAQARILLQLALASGRDPAAVLAL